MEICPLFGFVGYLGGCYADPIRILFWQTSTTLKNGENTNKKSPNTSKMFNSYHTEQV